MAFYSGGKSANVDYWHFDFGNDTLVSGHNPLPDSVVVLKVSESNQNDRVVFEYMPDAMNLDIVSTSSLYLKTFDGHQILIARQKSVFPKAGIRATRLLKVFDSLGINQAAVQFFTDFGIADRPQNPETYFILRVR
jgi:hypothetical protein